MPTSTPPSTGWPRSSPQDELLLRRLKKRRLALRDQIARLERDLLDPKEPA